MCLLRLQDAVVASSSPASNSTAKRNGSCDHCGVIFQIVFQDPYASLSPRLTVEQILREGLQIHFAEQNAEQHHARILQVLDEVGLSEDMLWRYPHEILWRPTPTYRDCPCGGNCSRN